MGTIKVAECRVKRDANLTRRCPASHVHFGITGKMVNQVLNNGENTASAQRPRGRPPKEREPRRRKIIAAAAELFTAQGYSETTLEAVARSVSMNKRTIYELVGDKEQLFREVCYDFSTIDELSFNDSIDETSLRNSLIALGKRVIGHGTSDRIIGLERAVIAEARKFPELMDEVVAGNFIEGNQRVAECLRHLQRLKLMPERDVSLSSDLFFDVVVGQLVTKHLLGRHVPPDDSYVAMRVDLFLRCYEMLPLPEG